MFTRKQVFDDLGKESCFLWGPRQTGKSTLVKNLFPKSKIFDLLKSDEFLRLFSQPHKFREEILSSPENNLPIIVDEIQKVPLLLDEVHWLIVNHKKQFILCGSNARKIIRSGGNLLGGRAIRYELFPLVYPEIKDFDLLRALNHGMLPRHYLSENPARILEGYIGDYLREEILQESLVRSTPAFHKFLEAVAFSNGELVNFSNIARDCGVSVSTVKEHFQILIDNLTGHFITSYKKKPKRRVIEAPKFYFFDLGMLNSLLNRGKVKFKSELFGKAFEQFIFQELIAYRHYSGKKFPISFWRTASQLEVDFILGEHEVALEIKGTDNINSQHLKGLKAFSEEYKTKKSIVVSTEPKPLKRGEILILPWEEFLIRLWSDEII